MHTYVVVHTYVHKDAEHTMVYVQSPYVVLLT
jgi:hypothetical protein